MIRKGFRKKTKIIIVVIFVFICVNLSLFMTNDDLTFSDKDGTLFDSNFLNDLNTVNVIRSTTMPVWERDLQKNDTQIVYSLKEANVYMSQIDSLKSSETVVIHYTSYSRQMPHFIHDSDREYFMKSPLNMENLREVPQEQLRGIVEVIPNGTFQMEYTCGFGSDSEYFRKERTSDFTKYYDTLVPLVIPMGFLFQHFFDGTFPKIVQAFEFIKRPNTKILLERPNHDNVLRILEQLNITQEKVVWHRRNDVRTVYHAKLLINTCVAPPLHPSLWKQMRTLLGVSEVLSIPYGEALVMLLTRAGATNGGRNALNTNAVYDYLSKRYGNKLVIFNSQHDMKQAMAMFSEVKIIIGTHGGAFYNMNYAPINTTIIEFVPYDYGGRDIRALPHAIFWAMANIIGQPYWRVMSKSENYQHDMLINVTKLDAILNVVDP